MDTPEPPLLERCHGGPWNGRWILRPGRTIGFNVMYSPGLIHCYEYIPTTVPDAPRWIYKGVRTKTEAESIFDVRYYYREG